MTKSAIYEGTVYHKRMEPKPHEFEYRVFMLYLDLDELPDLFAKQWFWSASKPNLVWFRRADYMGPTDEPLKKVVLDKVEAEIGRRPRGSVRVLTHLRTMGYVFNPVSFYYCFDENDRLEAIAAEITNTPWKERHTYVLDARAAENRDQPRWEFGKTFHVSPFFGMNQNYVWSFQDPGEELVVRMTNWEDGRPVFHAGLQTERREVTGKNLSRALLRHPLLTLRVHAAIYWQAARLWLKRIPFFTHPKTSRVQTPATETRS